MDSVTREALPADSYHMPEESHSSSESVASTPRRLVTKFGSQPHVYVLLILSLWRTVLKMDFMFCLLH